MARMSGTTRTLAAIACLAVAVVPVVPSPAAASGRLAGKIVGIDPGHNGRNYSDPSYIDHKVWNGREWEACDTTGTQTTSHYTEALFNFNVATYLAADLKALGASIVWTRTHNDGVGPCVDRRAKLLNNGHAKVSIDIHADGGPTGGRGFAILEPVADGPNNKVITSSESFGRLLRGSFLHMTEMPMSTYDGKNGLAHRNDLAGLNLTNEPKVLIEVGNMRNATDARLLTSKSWQQKAARAMADAITKFLVG
jgi:N-acetylmuramoyl-L-alanine amidase